MRKFKEQIKIIFQQTKSISCPAFKGEKIYFNAKGINHLIYKGSRSRRDENRINANIRLLPRAIKLLTISTVWQEENQYIRDKKEEIRGIKNAGRRLWLGRINLTVNQQINNTL